VVQRERGAEERVAGLVGRQVLGGRPDSTDHAGILGSGPVDEARLADAGGEQFLQVAERLVDLVQHLTAGADLGGALAGQLVEATEGRVAGGQQVDRLGP
jgi:hypothetical protein